MVTANVFKTGKSLQFAIDHPERIKGMQDYLDMNFAYLFFDLDGKAAEEALGGELFEVPYWIDKYYNKTTESGENKYWAQYIPDMFEDLNIGDIMFFEEGTMAPAGKYKYIDSVPLSEEVEHQADNGEFVYESRGYSFLRIWKYLGK